ncbi:hypothetical protein Taro_013969 [Colocasia esculenta]|uniref:Uncharacterized protein n=1 Tax=Colocasia esculenta TaxID=4460 RepID=A0A843UH09_COLES|nr:hypothetical protein [Colocasia esculenta]
MNGPKPHKGYHTHVLVQHRCDAALNWTTVTKRPPRPHLWGVGVSLSSHWLSRELPQHRANQHRYGSSKLR